MTPNQTQKKLLSVLTPGAICMPKVLHAAGNVPAGDFPLGTSDALTFGGGLIAVVFAIILLGALYAWTQGSRSRSNGLISVLATQAIGPKEKITIVEVADKHLLIGSTTTSVHTLHVFDEAITLDAEPRTSFANRLKSALGSNAR